MGVIRKKRGRCHQDGEVGRCIGELRREGVPFIYFRKSWLKKYFTKTWPALCGGSFSNRVKLYSQDSQPGGLWKWWAHKESCRGNERCYGEGREKLSWRGKGVGVMEREGGCVMRENSEEEGGRCRGEGRLNLKLSWICGGKVREQLSFKGETSTKGLCSLTNHNLAIWISLCSHPVKN